VSIVQQLHLSVVLLVAGSALLLLSFWSRWGQGRRARWWMRTVPLSDPRRVQFAGKEVTGLVVIPFFALELLNFGIGIFPPVSDQVFGITVLLFFVLLIGTAPCGRFWVMPAWVYPARPTWLRAQRRAELSVLKRMPGGRAANYWGFRHGAYWLFDWESYAEALAEGASAPRGEAGRAPR
jgi:hypothetical protein